MEGDYLYMEKDYIIGNVNEPKGESFLEREKVSYCKWEEKTTVGSFDKFEEKMLIKKNTNQLSTCTSRDNYNH